jgi:hypothetical protein
MNRFAASLEGNWEIQQITYQDKDTTISYGSPRPLITFLPCEYDLSTSFYCEAEVRDQAGNASMNQYIGGWKEKDSQVGTIKFSFPYLERLNEREFDSTLVFNEEFEMTLHEDTLMLSGGEIRPYEGLISSKVEIIAVERD